MSLTNIVTPEWLSAHLNDPAIKILDCTTYMLAQPVGPSKIESGRAQYLKGHIPGAQHVCMEQDFSEPGARFAFTVPSPDTFNRVMQRLGINLDDHVVLYGHQQMSVVTRIWFVLHAMGHQKISILNGGLTLWVKSGMALSTQVPTLMTSHYKAVPKAERVAGIDEINEAISDPQKVLLNALKKEQFLGMGGAHYGRPGRIPNSRSWPATDLYDPQTGEFKGLEELTARLGQLDLQAGQQVINYCGGGIAATTTAFVLETLGFTNWSVYDNSMNEWANAPDKAVQTGE
ncbi:MAG: sulfurtransferase [Alcaligenaceae bacterium]